MAATCIILLINFFYSLRDKSQTARTLSMVLFSAILIIVSYIAALFCRDARLSSISYSIYFISNTWVCISIFLFAHVYTNHKKHPRWIKNSSIFFIAADNISLMLNPWTHHEVLYTYAETYSLSCWKFKGTGWFQFHLILCYVLLSFFVIEIIAKIIHSPRFYRRQYIVILLILFTCVVGNGFFLILSDVIDLSVILYGFVGAAFYYFALGFLPKKLREDMGQLVLTRMNSALVFFDLDGKCIFSNKLARNWFGLKQRESTLQELTRILSFDLLKADEKQVICLGAEGAEKYYRVGYQQFADSQKRYLGCYFQLEDITEEQIENQNKIYAATHDVLTGIYNQATFYQESRNMLDQNPDRAFSVITTNISQFKILNDLLGREKGDELLKSIGEAFHTLARDHVIFGRLESDKFAVCAPAEAHLEHMIQWSITDLLNEMEKNINLSLSIFNYCGVYTEVDHSLQVSVMCDRANMALSTVRDNLDCRIGYYDVQLRNEILMENTLTAELHNALETRQFLVYYQPQMDSRTNKIVGAEALVRWKHPQNGLISPGLFIPLFEKKGYIYELDQYVWDAACRDLKTLRSSGFIVPVSVNISPRDVYSVDICPDIMSLVKRYGLPAESLNLEITESAAILNMDKMMGIIQRLHEYGFKIEMDDFGSGYSSLNTLKDIPVDILKLDMKFLQDAKNSERSSKIITMVSRLSQALNTPMIAEGVEEKAQLDFLLDIGCHNLQGYYYSKPVPFEEFLKLLQKYEIGKLE